MSYVEVDSNESYDMAESPEEVDCALGEDCAHIGTAKLGWVFYETDTYAGLSWNIPWIPEGADPHDTCLWVCEDDAVWIESMAEDREWILGLP